MEGKRIHCCELVAYKGHLQSHFLPSPLMIHNSTMSLLLNISLSWLYLVSWWLYSDKWAAFVSKASKHNMDFRQCKVYNCSKYNMTMCYKICMSTRGFESQLWICVMQIVILSNILNAKMSWFATILSLYGWTNFADFWYTYILKPELTHGLLFILEDTYWETNINFTILTFQFLLE